jgi:predicted dehydrogenase
MNIKYGIIGCGVIGAVHAHALSQLTDARLVGVCDIIKDRADSLATQYNVPYVTADYHDLLARPDIDAICIGTPHYLHAPMAIAAAKEFKHIFCEKPLAIRPADMDAMIEAAEQAKMQLGVCFQHRFDPEAVRLKELITSGQFGTLLLGGAACCCLRDIAYYKSAAWRGTWEQEGGGVLINQAIHTIDLLLWLLGDVAAVTAQMATRRWGDTIEVEDTASALLSFANGAQGQIIATTASHLDWHTRLQIFATEGSAEITTDFPGDMAAMILSGKTAEPLPREEAEPEVGKPCYGNSHIRALACFTDCLLNNRPFPISGRAGRKASELVQAIYRSAKTGKRVNLPMKRD